jgi:hypothetical protein
MGFKSNNFTLAVIGLPVTAGGINSSAGIIYCTGNLLKHQLLSLINPPSIG